MVETNVYLMAGFFITFCLLLLILNAILFQPILSHIDARKSYLQKDQGSADDDIAESLRLKAEAAGVIANAKKAASKVKEEALTAAKARADELLGAERERIAAEIARFEKGLETDEANLRNALLGEAPLIKERIKTKFVAA
ncbi:hypothetical protein FACS189487_09470 [Campylobacterota bacterium]|nr:hypothetical protein FACS189487_09470 [Campylobacterota bacterium]